MVSHIYSMKLQQTKISGDKKKKKKIALFFFMRDLSISVTNSKTS